MKQKMQGRFFIYEHTPNSAGEIRKIIEGGRYKRVYG